MALRIAAVTAVMFVAVQLVAAGYEYGFGEQVLLSVKGISWADPTAYVNDWFNDRAPQPHVLFDVVTYLAERAGLRPQVYFLYWLTSLAVTAAGVVVLSETWLPRRARPFELLVGAMMVTGPYFALGTFLVIHREAVPNGLGGALGFLTATLLIARRDRAALICAVVTTVVHVQHGTVVAVLLLAAWLVTRDRLRRPVLRWYPVAVLIILGTVLVVARARGLVSGNGDVSDVCETASPGHCHPDVWAPAVIRDGVAIVLAGVAAPFLARVRPTLRTVALVVAPALIALTALVTDLVDLQPFQDLGRQFFLYRFVMVVAPFAPVAAVLALTRPLKASPRRLDWLVAGAGALGFLLWHTAAYANIYRFRTVIGGVQRATLVIALLIVLAIAVWTLLIRSRLRTRTGLLDQAVLTAVAVGAVVLLLVFGGRATGWVPLRLDYAPGEGAVALGRSIEEATPPGSVIVARPDIGWLRLLSRRGVVIDCKGVPYGGVPWQEYNERLAALGVASPLECGSTGFATLTADDLAEIGERFGATHVLLDPGDVAFGEALDAWTRLTGEGLQTSLFELPRS